ncbi:hypothetical protein RvY_11350 [Ramazzottius varieornatus]|uniref:Platelet-derived growth factor (PDGF) family profile domain-containing protein n=1 Tax=Ramazzottius varieornatus TaxID=947166 RepID=A0A1D1VNK0_RAMVA|nr:hypothetical protein RvY_11350 [Ramazzottius varieornatus]
MGLKGSVIFVIFVSVLCVGFSSAHFEDDHHLLRDMSLHDEEDFDRSSPQLEFYQIPADALLEMSQLTTEEFMNRFAPKDQRIRILSAAPDDGTSPLRETQDEGLPAAPAELYSPLVGKFTKLEPAELPQADFVSTEDTKPSEQAKTPEATSSENAHGKEQAPLPPSVRLFAGNFRTARLLETRADAPFAENAICTPRDTVIRMPLPSNKSLTIWPECTTVKQCGGCCGNGNLVCKATGSQQIQRQGMHLAYIGGTVQFVGSTVVELTEDSQCTCQCRQNASDCNANQRYEPANCRCVCKNQNMSTSCGPNRVWDVEKCECKCPNATGKCPIGFHFDSAYYCSCLPNSELRSARGFLRSKKADIFPPVSIYQMGLLERRTRSGR